MSDDKTKRMTLTGLMCAIVVITTMFVAVPIPGVQGAYVNVGDVAVYASAFLLGWPWGVAAAAVGSGLADLLLGSALYAPATFIIKGLMAFIAARLIRGSGMKIPRLLVSGIVMAAGYFGYECIIYGASVAVLSITGNLVQAALGAVLGSIVIKGIETLQK